ncbi:hypothetical protein L210DRAFT_951277 [Boletus edulis BED1]|uniref:DUF6533 domain-containing protein n=1 Tax=Boletus edulis BED1 TaxID=1328754 RepID=A0AAD4G891_BOLED|nr:hypothetical protein L210DRAFT_951277 [Boletus edulis BED1]
MSSDLQSAVELIRLNDYTTVMIVAAVTYDYCLTFSREVDYIWCRSWTWVSTIFVLVRYIGLCWAILGGLIGSTFVPGPVRVSTALILVTFWGFPIFLAAADLVMIFRVYAIWNRSTRILYVLLFVFAAQVVSSFILTGLYDSPNTYLLTSVVQVDKFSFCNSFNVNLNTTLLLFGYLFPRYVLSAMLVVLAIIPTLKQAVEMHRATKQWQPNLYVRQLVKDGILYFLVNLINNVASTLTAKAVTNEIWILFLNVVIYITLCPIIPRFIISIRELYDRDGRGRVQGIDTGFGASSQLVASQDGTVSAIAFADAAPGRDLVAEEDADKPDAIQLEARGGSTSRV